MHLRKLLPALPLAALLTACGEDVSGGEVVAGGLGIYALLSIVHLLIILWAAYDLISKPYPVSKKLIWGLVILFIPFLGAVLYLFMGRNKQEVF
ncbi:PLD nuclease N-terminal domain-containing protein [Neolewinella sp.]|uniref:PLD nuclease N-terminal domain-containing protein n=1 Tax=Neolewinella sp. TaxID=2993543 RepID=UPI003B521DB5